MTEKNLNSINAEDSEKVSGGCIESEYVSTGSHEYGTRKTRYRIYKDDDYYDNVPLVEGIETFEEAKKEAEKRGLSTKSKYWLFPADVKANHRLRLMEAKMKAKNRKK